MTTTPTRSRKDLKVSKEEFKSDSPQAPNLFSVVAYKSLALAYFFVPLIGFIYAVVSLWSRGVSWLSLGYFFGGFFATSFGITVGYHRLFTHGSFKTFRPIRWLFGILGSMAFEGPLFQWVKTHLDHHPHSDTDLDPHSPHGHGDGLWGLTKGFLFAHIGWWYNNPFGLSKEDKVKMRRMLGRDMEVINALYWLWVALSLALPPLSVWGLSFFFKLSHSDIFQVFVWGSLARVCAVLHASWSINSLGHLFGSRKFRSTAGDMSTDNILLAPLTQGESFHRKHHAFPKSAWHGLYWWCFDTSWYLIWSMKKLRLAWDVYVPSRTDIEAKRIG